MSDINSLSTLLFMLLYLGFFYEARMSSWDFAVTTQGKIIFYNSSWQEISTAAEKYHTLSAFTFDETDETVYFNDQSKNGSIFSLQLDNLHQNHNVTMILKNINDEHVRGMTFDTFERTLYWTDARNHRIYQMSLKDTPLKPTQLFQLTSEETPISIGFDVCRRKLYWTTKNNNKSLIERANIDGTKREVIVSTGLYMPNGIVVDQFSKRIYWVDDLVGDHYSVASSELDGSDNRILIQDVDHIPLNLAADRNFVYWTDPRNSAIWKLSKYANNTDNSSLENMPERVLTLDTEPKGIITRDNFLAKQGDNPECLSIVNKIKTDIFTSAATDRTTKVATPFAKSFCLNQGNINPKTGKCICLNAFDGTHCEIPICMHFCIGGECHVSSTGYAECKCNKGFVGERCERYICDGYCLNNGHCKLEQENAVCDCEPSFHGRRCEHLNTKEMCRLFCLNSDKETDWNADKVCGNCSANGFYDLDQQYIENEERTTQVTLNQLQEFPSCKYDTFNKTAIFVSAGMVISLGLIYLIFSSMRRLYTPLRPKIKKTYVVNKTVRSTPLTCRPTTEQCEITIEDCCNMNICDTPCYDPTMIHQNKNKTQNKGDKKKLLTNMDGDLY